MKVFTIHEAETNLSKLIELACQQEEVLIARGPELLVRLVPVKQVRNPRQPGALKGKLHASDPSSLNRSQPTNCFEQYDTLKYFAFGLALLIGCAAKSTGFMADCAGLGGNWHVKQQGMSMIERENRHGRVLHSLQS